MENMAMLCDESEIYVRSARVRYSETGCDGLLKPLKVFDLFQDTAMEHADLMGVSSAQLSARNLTWFVVRHHVQFSILPRWNQPVTVKTWRYPQRNLYDIRHYEIHDEEARLLVQARSMLVIIDTLRKQPVRLSRALSPMHLVNNGPQKEDFVDIPAVANPEFEQLFPIRKQDLDFNGHVNNAVFIGWALENLPEVDTQPLLLREIEVTYLSDIMFGQTVKAQGQVLSNDAGPVILYHIVDNQTARVTTRMRIAWSPVL